jgi:hypothetical protein
MLHQAQYERTRCSADAQHEHQLQQTARQASVQGFGIAELVLADRQQLG